MLTETLLTAATGGAGGVVGLVGSMVMGGVKRRAKRKDAEFQLEMLERQAAMGLKAEEVKLVTATHAEQAAYAQNAPPWVLGTLALVRPILTLALLGMAAWLHLAAPESMFAHKFMALASIAVGWWFGDRSQR